MEQERAYSPYSNSLCIITKQDGFIRIYLDARRVNKILEDLCEKPLPVEEAIGRIKYKKWFSSIDLTTGY